MTEQDFDIWVDMLSDGRSYTIVGKIISDCVIFYLPFEPTVRDFSLVLQAFRKIYNMTDNFKFSKYIQPARYNYGKYHQIN